ncbi:MAG: SRPBCC family protein, partial [Actinobacteria bacterium]|nr:SRPBCC family protein [Actinomycetota bacterium]
MKPIVLDVEIAASPALVWGVASDVRNAADAVPAIRSIEILDGPAEGLGMRWRETRIMFGREAT